MYMYVLITTVFASSYRLYKSEYKMRRKKKAIGFEQDLCEMNGKETVYTARLRTDNRDIWTTDGRITEVQL